MRPTAQPSSPHPQTTRLSAIRQSAYKLQRSTSHRKDHSLERKPPLIIKPKLTPRNTPAQPRWPSPPHSNHTAQKDGSNLLAFFETAETEAKEDGKIEKGCYRTGEDGVGQGESFVGEVGWKETQLIADCLAAIEQAISKIRQTGHFLSQTSQMRQLLIDMRQALPRPAQRSAAPPLCQFEMRRIQCLLEENSSMQSHLSSLMIENEASHQLQFLSLYEAGQDGKMQLKDITNLGGSARKTGGSASPFHSAGGEESTVTLVGVDKGSSSHSNDRVFLKNIVKRANPHPLPHPQTPTSYSSPGSEVYFTPCNLFTCETNPPDESDSKREVLNQIIDMLNRKYNKNISLGLGKERN